LSDLKVYGVAEQAAAGRTLLAVSFSPKIYIFLDIWVARWYNGLAGFASDAG
jgi:hypothetical protein